MTWMTIARAISAYSFSDSASLVEQLELVVSVGVAHLSAAQGKPTRILLTHFLDWRWPLDRKDSRCYPTVRLFRQIVVQVARELGVRPSASR